MKLPLTISLLTVAAVTALELRSPQCVISGCSGQICASTSRLTTCEWREEYACYRGATCEIQENGLCGWTMTDKLKTCLNPFIKPAECRKTGCSGQICSDQDIETTCEWTDSYACYLDATCERQTDGQCGWIQTEELQACLNPEQKACMRTGCSGQICSDEDIATTCEWIDSYTCYQDAICERQADGQCGWAQTEELQSCLNPETYTTPEDNTCKKTGCSGQICSDQDIETTCEWTDSYACYLDATCERQSDGQCGWIQTEELQACLNLEQKTCMRTGCSGQICSDQDVMTTCDWREQYACYKGATCERQTGGQCGWAQTEELQSCLNSGTNSFPVLKPCRKTGCSGELCTDQALGIACEWTESNVCYQDATCERQADGECGWTQTEELQSCLNPETYTTPVIPGPCVRGGCSGQICGEEDPNGGLFSTCEWREEYACYGSATCERQEDGQCGWTMTKELEECFSNSGPSVEVAQADEPGN